jgi:hypothetical protein
MENIKTFLKKQEERIKKHIREELKRHIGVLKEDFDNKVALIAKQYDSIREALDSHSQKLDFHSK